MYAYLELEFVERVSTSANKICEESGKKTITNEHLYKALKATIFLIVVIQNGESYWLTRKNRLISQNQASKEAKVKATSSRKYRKIQFPARRFKSRWTLKEKDWRINADHHWDPEKKPQSLHNLRRLGFCCNARRVGSWIRMMLHILLSEIITRSNKLVSMHI